jgi:hypothetical protein
MTGHCAPSSRGALGGWRPSCATQTPRRRSIGPPGARPRPGGTSRALPNSALPNSALPDSALPDTFSNTEVALIADSLDRLDEILDPARPHDDAR